MVVVEKLHANDSQSIKIISNMMYEWWGRDSYISLNAMEEIIKSYCINDTFPVVLVAKIENEIVGTVTLLANDTQLRQDLFPIISSLYIKENYRNQGIGKLLMKSIIGISKQYFNRVYLLTRLEDYYEKMGFEYLEDTYAFIDLSNNQLIKDRLYMLDLNKKGS